MTALLFLLSFNRGERLVYSAKYEFLTIGRMILEVRDTLTYQDRKCYRIVSILNSNPKLGFLFNLNDTIETIATQDSLLPLASDEKIHEGKYVSHNRIAFDQPEQLVVYGDTQTISTLPATRDLLSFWYWLRMVPLAEGMPIKINIHKSRKNYAIECRIANGGRIRTDLGDFNTIMVSPQTKDKGIFGAQGGMTIWYADDSTRYPVQIKTAMKYGKILFKLQGVKN
jgi:hypothetical protein